MFVFKTSDDKKVEIEQSIVDAISVSSFTLCYEDTGDKEFITTLTEKQLDNVARVFNVRSKDRIKLDQLFTEEYGFAAANMMIPMDIVSEVPIHIEDEKLRLSTWLESTKMLQSRLVSCLLDGIVMRVNDSEYKNIISSSAVSKLIPVQILCENNVIKMICIEQGIPIYVIGKQSLPHSMLESRNIAHKEAYGRSTTRSLCYCDECMNSRGPCGPDGLQGPCGPIGVWSGCACSKQECFNCRNTTDLCGDNTCKGILTNKLRYSGYEDLISIDGHKYINSVVTNRGELFTYCPSHPPKDIALNLSNEEVTNIVCSIRKNVCSSGQVPLGVILAFVRR